MLELLVGKMASTLATFVRWWPMVPAEAGSRLLSALKLFPYSMAPMYVSIRKKDAAIRPIAVGSTIERLSLKVGSRQVVQALGEELRPAQ